MEEKLWVAELIAEASFKKKKRDAEYQAEALRMEEELAKARSRAKVYNNIEGIDLRIGKVTEVFLAEKIEDNEVSLPNVPKGVAIEKGKSRQFGYNPLYIPWGKVSTRNLPILSSYHLCDTDPEKVGSWSEKEATLENQNKDRSTSRKRQQDSVHEKSNAAEMLSKLVREQSVPQVDKEVFEGNRLDFT